MRKGTLENRRIVTRRAVLQVVNDNPVTYELHAASRRKQLRNANASRVTEHRWTHSGRARAGTSFRYSFALIRLGYWLAHGTAGWTKRAFLSPHPAYLVSQCTRCTAWNAAWAAPVYLKHSLCLCRTRRPREQAAFVSETTYDFHRYLQPSPLSWRIPYKSPVVAIKR